MILCANIKTNSYFCIGILKNNVGNLKIEKKRVLKHIINPLKTKQND